MKHVEILRDKRKFAVEMDRIDTWNYKVDVYEILPDDDFVFCGKAISNDPEHAAGTIIRKHLKRGD